MQIPASKIKLSVPKHRGRSLQALDLAYLSNGSR